MVVEALQREHIQLDWVEHFEEVEEGSIFNTVVVPAPGFGSPETTNLINQDLERQFGHLSDMIRYYQAYGIDNGSLKDQPLIENLHARVVHTDLGDHMTIRWRAFDRLMQLDHVIFEADYLSADITIADWDTYVKNISGENNPPIDPATVIMSQEYNEDFTLLCEELLGQGLPPMGLYTITPYDKVRYRFFRPFVDRINSVREAEAFRLGLGNDDYMPIMLNDPLNSGHAAKSIPLQR